MQGFATSTLNGRRCVHLIQLITASIVVCSLALFSASPAALAQGVATPAPALSANGCLPERADQSYICPGPNKPGHALVEYLYSDRTTDAIGVRLTPKGVEMALTCEGAADIAAIVVDLYEQVPREERARDSIEWAEPQMTNEIRAHARLGEIPEFRAASNPVDIVFPHYEGAYRDASADMWDFSQQVVFGSLGNCQ